MLQTLKKFYKFKKPFYGINSGDYGFLMNKFSEKNTIKNLIKDIEDHHNKRTFTNKMDIKYIRTETQERTSQ